MLTKNFKRYGATAMLALTLVVNQGEIYTFAKNQDAHTTTAKAITTSTVNGEVDFGKGTASILITGNEGQTLKGKDFRIYKLFCAEKSEGEESFNYTFAPECENALKQLVATKLSKPISEVTEYVVVDYFDSFHKKHPESKDGEFRFFIEELRNELKKQGVQGNQIHIADEKMDGSVKICGLEYGYYILDEESKVQGQHSAASLCMVNTAAPNVDIHIKSDYPTVEKKIQEDDAKAQIRNDGWNDIGDFEIGQTVPYKYSSKIPDMNGYQKYYFAWHDKMSPSLTLKKDTISISITSEGTSAKTYQLKTGEFQVQENPVGEETFVIKIENLKEIVDREFPNKNASNENVYGQKIEVRYDAILNELAADDTGRPGFENDVKLEFSNNPDSDGGGTGETPWDTVVCFTYTLNGLKTNDQNKVLPGAKFRLYSDEGCTEEVYVKARKNGYVVINRDSVGGTDHIGGTKPQEAIEMISDEKGIFTIWGLDGGTYWLKETKAPSGYRPLLDPIKITVKPQFCANRNEYVKGDGATEKVLMGMEMETYIQQFIFGAFDKNTTKLNVNLEDGAGNLIVVNKAGARLPGTGSSMMIVIVALGIGCSVYALKKEGNRYKKD